MGLGLEGGKRDVIVLHDGTTLTTHGPARCADVERCPIHHPSDHPLRLAPLAWAGPSLPSYMLRVCEHGQQHPDPDSLHFLASRGRMMLVEAIDSTHLDPCDGCCRTVPEPC